VTPNGKFVSFLVSGLQEQPLPVPPGSRQIYLYSLENNTLRCASCGLPLSTSEKNSIVQPAATDARPELAFAGVRPRFLSDDGKVFFSTAGALVTQDTNSVHDVYVYDPATGENSLISTGRGKAGAYFTDASAAGDDLFFVTRQPILARDTDELVDVYDARIGGGFEETPTSAAECSGEGCQGSPSTSPGTADPASHAEGKGNVHQKRCKRRSSKAHSSARKPCKKKKATHRKRTVHTTRRNG
jgi:hypothetical protein